MSADKKGNKLVEVEADEDEEEEGDEDHDFSPEVLKRVVGLRKLHAEVEEIDDEYKAERVQLEMKYLAKKQPIFEKRKQIIAGTIEPEFPAPEEGSTEPEVPATEGEPVVGIPEFWLHALANHPTTGELICEDDVDALRALDDISIAYDETYNTFTLSFAFKENAFFTNTVLTKKYSLTDILDEKGPQLLETVSSPIEWKEGKNLCVTEIKKKQKAKSGKNKGQVRQIVKQVPKASFFNYFSDPKEDEEDDEEDEKEGEDKERTSLTEEEDYEVAHAIRTCLIPDAIMWFTGEAQEGDFDDEDDEDDEDDDEEDDEEDEDEEEEEAPKKGKGGKGGKGQSGFAAPAPGGAEQPECKQN